MNWKGAQAFMAQKSEKSNDELYQMATNSRYFSPPDYSTHTFGYLQSQHGDDYRLSTSCKCPICQHNTIRSILENFEEANSNSRAHHVISYRNEAKNFQKALHDNETDEFIDSKSFAKRIID
jgi:queuine/archaeosine tRNA-ribosyltransferase